MPDGNRLPEPYASLADGLGAAQAALMRGDRDGALGIWAALRAQFPDHPAPVARAIPVLAQLGREDEAQSLLAEAQEKFPSDPSLAAERARLAQIRRDFPAAIRLWEDMRARFPQNVTAYLGAAACLRDAGRLDDAEREIAAALERFPNLPGPMMESARLAQARRDWPEAARRWESVRSLFPDHVAGYMGGAIALREAGRPDEADALLRAAVERFPADAGAAIDYARLAQTRVDWPEALRRWDDARARFPDVAAVSVGMALALRQSGRLDEAERLAAEAMVRFPNEAGLALEYARAATARRDWPEAALRWEQVRNRFPGEASGHLLGAAALREARRLDEAEGLLEAALPRFVRDAGLGAEYARIAQARRDWPEAVRRWQELIERHPGLVTGYVGAASALRLADRIDDAETIAAAAMDRFPDEAGPVVEYAWAAHARGNWPESVRRWSEVCRRFPDHPAGPAQRLAAVAALAKVEAPNEPVTGASQPAPAPVSALPDLLRRICGADQGLTFVRRMISRLRATAQGVRQSPTRE